MEDEETPVTDTLVKFPKKSKRAPPGPHVEVAAPPPTASPEVVSYLTKLLERAKRGEIQAFGFASVSPEHIVSHSMYVVNGEFQHELVAGLAYLSHELIAQNMSDEEDDDDDED